MDGTAGAAGAVRLRPWAEGDLALMRRVNTPGMKKHVGGPESEERMLARHRRYTGLAAAGTGCMFAVLLGGVDGEDGEAVGTVGYAERDWRGGRVYEMGWNVLPPFQGRGIAAAAARLAVADARVRGTLGELHAFPSVDHPASNAVCRRAGFSLLTECDFEFPPGRFMRSNDWCVDLTAS